MNFLLGVAAIVGVVAICCPAWAQATPPAQLPYATQPGPQVQQPYRYTTPEDAYRAGLLTRWQLEQLVGPTPQALQGPIPNSDKGEGMQ